MGLLEMLLDLIGVDAFFEKLTELVSTFLPEEVGTGHTFVEIGMLVVLVHVTGDLHIVLLFGHCV